MKRLHVHTRVGELAPAVAFYSAVFGAPPVVRKDDYAKWRLDDPRLNFAISARGGTPGVDHLGLEFETSAEMEAFAAGLAPAGIAGRPSKNTTCCYAKSDKVWLSDPDGLAWETFATHGSSEVYGEDDVDLADLERPKMAPQADAAKPCC